MMKAKEKLINFRPLFVCAILLGTSIFLMTRLFSNLLFLIPAILIFILLLLFCVFTKKYIFLIVATLIYLLGFGLTALSICTYSHNFEKQECVLSGRVVKISETDIEGLTYINVENVNITLDEETKHLSGITTVSIYGYADNVLSIGDQVSFTTKISSINLLEGTKIDNYHYTDNIRYVCSVSYDKLQLVNGNCNFLESIKITSKDKLFSSLGKENGSVAYAVLFGDSDIIEGNITDAFRASGISHILAVSGLHVSFLFALIYFLLRAIPTNRWVKFSILLVCMFVYCLMCNFTPSVVRATIMCSCLFLSKLLGKQSDSLSSLSLSAIIILLFKPIYIFDVGFLMSFGAVFGILLTLRLFSKIPIKNIVVKNLLATITVTICAQIGIIPMLAGYFNSFATYSIFANILVLPLFGIFYPILCFVNLVAIILPFMSFLYVLPQALLSCIIAIANFVSSLPYATVKLYDFGLIAGIVFYLILFVASDFINLKTRTKAIVCSVLSFVCIGVVVFINFPYKFNTNTFSVSVQTPYFAKVTTSNNGLYLVDIDTSTFGLRKIREEMKDNHIYKIDGLIFTNNKNFQANLIRGFCEEFSNPVIYINEEHTAVANLRNSGFSVVTFKKDKKIGVNSKLSLKQFVYGDCYLTQIEISDNLFLIVNGNLNNDDILDVMVEISQKFNSVVIEDENITIDFKGMFNTENYFGYGEICDIVI